MVNLTAQAPAIGIQGFIFQNREPFNIIDFKSFGQHQVLKYSLVRSQSADEIKIHYFLILYADV
jgi:hypothetical protein